MAFSDLGFLSPNQIKVWQKKDRFEWLRKSWILKNFAGKGQNQPIELITDMKEGLGGGLSCVMHLVNNLVEDGQVGSVDGDLEGKEESIKHGEQVIQIDQLMKSVKAKGKLMNQNTVIDFRSTAHDSLTYFGANHSDQLAMLTLSGISYAYNLNGTLRGKYDSEGNWIVDPTYQNFKFASDVSAPSSLRHVMWDPLGLQWVLGDTTAITPASQLTWKGIVQLKAYAQDHRIPPLMQGGKEWRILLVTPYVLAQLKCDPDFNRAIIQAGVRGDENPWFTGADVKVDGIVIYSTDYVYRTTGAASGSKWGADSTVDGARNLLLGSQALGFADLEEWNFVEKRFQYNQFPAVFCEKLLGFLKPQYFNTMDGSIQDYAVVAVDTYTQGGGTLAPAGVL